MTDKGKEKRTVKKILKDASRQLIASVVILAIGFIALNWSAYYQIGKSKIENILGVDRGSVLREIAETERPANRREVLAIEEDLELGNKQIPELELEIAPVENRIIIPSINQNIPIVNVRTDSLLRRDWTALEKDMQEALRDGVVYYPGTSLPGKTGNTVITGHSSYFPWDPGRFKDVFARLHDVEIGDRVVVYHNQDKYIYEVFQKEVVSPDNIRVLRQTPDERLTLITCTPVGTNLRRLIVTAKPIAKNGIDTNNDLIPR